jgi:hypothetical protein
MMGKTTLVVALLRAGAHYYTDDFALLDGDGLVHPNLIFIKNKDKVTAAAGAVVLESERGEAEEAAGALLEIAAGTPG